MLHKRKTGKVIKKVMQHIKVYFDIFCQIKASTILVIVVIIIFVLMQVESFSIGPDHKLTEHEERDWRASSSAIHNESTREVSD